MKIEPEARVMTPDGTGKIVDVRRERIWPLGQHPRNVVWVIVELEHGGRRTYQAEQLEQLEEWPA